MADRVTVREALLSDSEICSDVLCASIRELCVADHHGNEEVVCAWTQNKTPDNIGRWIRDPKMLVYVAELSGKVAGVGGINDMSDIVLNYVSPEYRFCGISHALMSSLASTLRNRKVRIAKLTSTKTAHRFYKKAGWRDVSEPEDWLGMPGFPMEKNL